MADDAFQDDKQDDFHDPNPAADLREDNKLPEDNDTPFSAPSDTRDNISDTRQETDANIDSHEWYDEGLASAAEVSPPSQDQLDPLNPTTDAGGMSIRDKEHQDNQSNSV